MNAGTPQPQHHYQPIAHGYHRFVAVAPGLGRQIKLVCTLVGTLSLPVSFMIGVHIAWQRWHLPASGVGTAGFTILMGALAAFFCFVSGIVLTAGRVCVKGESLNSTFASSTRRVLGTLLRSALVSSAFAVFLFTGSVSASRSWAPSDRLTYNGSTIGYLVILATPLALTLVNTIVGWRMLRDPKGRQFNG